MSEALASKLLPALFERVDEEQRLVVLEAGPASQEFLDFFSQYRCRLHCVDLFSALPLVEEEDEDVPPLRDRLAEHLALPPDTRIDLCLFWDLFNFLDSDAINALMATLRPHLHAGTLAYAYGVHNQRAQRADLRYTIAGADRVVARRREQPLPGYAPHPQGELKSLLDCFEVQRSVLLRDSRLEMLLGARLPAN